MSEESNLTVSNDGTDVRVRKSGSCTDSDVCDEVISLDSEYGNRLVHKVRTL